MLLHKFPVCQQTTASLPQGSFSCQKAAIHPGPAPTCTCPGERAKNQQPIGDDELDRQVIQLRRVLLKNPFSHAVIVAAQYLHQFILHAGIE